MPLATVAMRWWNATVT